MSERLAIRILLGLGIFVLLVWAGREAWGILTMFGSVLALFFAAWLISFVLGPPTEALVRLRVRRPLAVFTVYILVLAALAMATLILTPVVVDQVGRLVEQVNTYTANTPLLVSWVEEQARAWGASEADVRNFYVGLIDQVRSLTGLILQNVLFIVGSAASFMVGTIFCLIISIYMMLDGRRIIAGALALVPKQYRYEARQVLQSINDSFGGYIRGQLILSAIYGIAVAVTMWLTGLDYIALSAIFAAFALIIPFIGPFVSLIPALVVAFLFRPADSWWIIIVFFIVQQVVLNAVGPRVFGRAVNMHPLLVIGGALIGATLAGVWGALFGIPIMGIIASVVRRLYQLHVQAEIEATDEVMAPPPVVPAPPEPIPPAAPEPARAGSGAPESPSRSRT